MTDARTRDAVIVGGGPSGGTAATLLARAGCDVLLIEKEPGPHHKVCGEFVSPDAQICLDELGIDTAALGAAPIDRVRLTRGVRSVETGLPFLAMSVSRCRLDEAVLAGASAAGATIRRGERVVGAAQAGGTWQVETDRGSRYRGSALFLATGKHELRGLRRPSGVQNDLIGFKMHLWRRGPARRLVDLFLFDGGYGGLEPVEDGVDNLCLAVGRREFAVLGRKWESLLDLVRHSCPPLAVQLDGSCACWTKPLAIAGIPYGYVAAPGLSRTLFRIGDQFAVVPSFAGNGIGIALHTARIAARTFLAQGDAADYAAAARRAVVRPVRRATWLAVAGLDRRGQAAAIGILAAVPGLAALVARCVRLSDRT